MARCEPTNTKDYLYLAVGNYGTINLTDLLERAVEHFGPCELSDLSVSPEWTKVDGCSCCYDSTDYENYLCVSLV
ncbi:hypothetical protein 16Q_137 [Pseudomonas phage 16Q]|nr:hypothetical protein 16Q_137 [Pseudomonas phage 16Q]